MTLFFVVYIFDDVRHDAPQPAERIVTMRQDDRNMRPMQLNAFIKLQNIVYSIWGNAWRMPKSVRDNYRSIRPVHHYSEATRMPQGERNE